MLYIEPLGRNCQNNASPLPTFLLTNYTKAFSKRYGQNKHKETEKDFLSFITHSSILFELTKSHSYHCFLQTYYKSSFLTSDQTWFSTFNVLSPSSSASRWSFSAMHKAIFVEVVRMSCVAVKTICNNPLPKQTRGSINVSRTRTGWADQ